MDNKLAFIHIRTTEAFIEEMDAFIARVNEGDKLGRTTTRSSLMRSLVLQAIEEEVDV